MIPIQLTIEGLYSYQKRQTIDFTTLTEAGLFGIFGQVGSGKSSILEAISYALYGETERLHSRDNRAYNMMNLKSNRSYIEFDFVNFENKKFRATREFKRNSKNFEDVKTSAVFYEWKNENWVTLETTKADEIIGLSYANFKRTIIIPQGQFKEFLELGAKDRTVMMKEIFGLERFDLQNKVMSLNSDNKTKLDNLEGQLKGFEEVNEEQILGQKEILTQQIEIFNTINLEFKNLEKKYQLQKNLKIDFENLNQKKEQFKKLEIQKTDIDLLEKKTEKFDQVYRIFSPLLSEKSKLDKSKTSLIKEKSEQSALLSKTETDFQSLKKDLEAILPKYKALEENKTQEHDLNLIVQMLGSAQEIVKLKERTKNGAEKVKEVSNIQELIKEKITDLNKNLETLKAKRIDANLLLNVGNWFSANKNLTQSFSNQSQKVTDCKANIQQIFSELKALKINEESFLDDFNSKNDAIEKEKKNLAEKRNHLEVQQKLAHFSTELHDGESCPLCGAFEHPNIVEFADVKIEIDSVEKQLQNLDEQQNELRKEYSNIEKIVERKKIFENQLKAEEEICSQLKMQQDNHVKTFEWKEFSAEKEAEFELKRKESFDVEKQIEELNLKIASEQKNLTDSQVNLDKFNKALQDFQLQEKEVETQISSNQSNLKVLKWNDFKEKEKFEVEENLAKLKISNCETEETYQILIKKEAELSPKVAEQKTIVKQLEKRILEIEKEISENLSNLNEALITNKFNEISEVQEILAEEINVVEIRKKVQEFNIDFGTLKNSIGELAEKLKDFTFDETEFITLENDFKIKETETKSASENLIKLKTEIDRLEIEFKKKEGLLKDLSQLQKRAENLNIMTNLFKGAGFVQYASSIYLRQLCDHANIRFHRMTRNQLSLQLNENNDFEIIDYLNEGKKRSVKTLSGGQSFQVSLSLALALAESVQSNAKAERNFFFIDEGFGTQDPESVQVVFETLLSLQKENRIVGIISHVEELKEKMPISLNIRKDDEGGSLIEVV
ncbi:AAA family ATPase [Kaistella sp. G5-32]|uniref:AAA family ATPase n=1 Tax=Kaistella gelatinilytica TaxID=2787636 RepID=A0ABS0F952_9FLAO|nr:AAA family ATPase [Kaistella gelatinilytica]MBF8456232.1 AAA family ATPase [Kaistella gelatinilytica]